MVAQRSCLRPVTQISGRVFGCAHLVVGFAFDVSPIFDEIRSLTQMPFIRVTDLFSQFSQQTCPKIIDIYCCFFLVYDPLICETFPVPLESNHFHSPYQSESPESINTPSLSLSLSLSLSNLSSEVKKHCSLDSIGRTHITSLNFTHVLLQCPC